MKKLITTEWIACDFCGAILIEAKRISRLSESNICPLCGKIMCVKCWYTFGNGKTAYMICRDHVPKELLKYIDKKEVSESL